MGRMYMSTKELNEAQVMEKVCKREIKLNKAAKLLNISTRHAIRLKKEHLEEGAAGLISKKVGKPSNNRISLDKKELVLMFLAQEKHRDFGPLLTHEYLSKIHSDFISVSSVRTIMIENGLWASKKNEKQKNL